MEWKTVDIAGLGPVQIPADIRFRQALIPLGQTLQRPGIPLAGHKADFWIQHETGNARAGMGAEAHSGFMDIGAPDDNGNPQQLGYHFTSDDEWIIQKLPVNEVSWQAADGGGPGNMDSVSCEMCVNVDADKGRTRRNAEYLCAAVCAGLGIPHTNITRHWDRNGHLSGVARHHCPDQMMNDGYWPAFLQHVRQILLDGEITTYARPIFFDLEKWDGTDRTLADGTVLYACNRMLTAKTRTKRYQLADPKAERIGPDIEAGETVEILYVFKTMPGGVRWAYTSFGTRLRLAHFDPFVKVAPAG